MAKPGILQALLPIAGIAGSLLAPELLPALGAAEAGGETAAEAVPFLIPGTDTALSAAGEAAPFLIPGTDIPLGGAEIPLGQIGSEIPLGTLPLGGAGLGAAPGVGGAAVAPQEIGAAPGGLLSAEAPPAGAAATPDLATTQAVGGLPAAAGTPATPASPISAAAAAPSSLSLSPDLTAAGGGLGLEGPPAGSTISTLATELGASPAAGGGAVGDITSGLPSDISNIAGFGPADAATTGGAAAGDLYGGPDFSGGGPADAGGPEGALGKAGDAALSAGNWALNHAGGLLAAGILGPQLLRGPQQYPQTQPISNIAGQIAPAGAAYTGTGAAGLGAQATAAQNEAAALEAPLTTGVLPPGIQQNFDAAKQAQKAQVRSNYASLGLTGSTMETDKLAQIDANTAAQQGQAAEGLLQPAQGFSGQALNAFSNLTSTGANLTGLSLNSYNALLAAAMKSDANYQTALYNFARALAGSGYTPPATSNA